MVGSNSLCYYFCKHFTGADPGGFVVFGRTPPPLWPDTGWGKKRLKKEGGREVMGKGKKREGK